ncbi:MAG: hypothetical protein ACLFST_06485 [Spirochaetia bacterium]
MRNVFCLLIFILMLPGYFVSAEDETEVNAIISGLKACYQIGNDANRLESYDQLAEQLGITKKSVNASESKWQVTVDKDPISDSKKIFFFLPAETNNLYDEVILIIRVQDSATELFVDWDDYLADNTKITVRFDKEDPYSVNWVESIDNTALFCNCPLGFIEKILQHNSLVLRTSPYDEGPKTAIFDISGLKPLAEQYNNDLKWF